MDEYDLIHWRRSFEEREALLRDISCRKTLGLPLEEPGRYKDANFFGKNYDPTSPLYRYDYWGEPKNSEKSKQERMTETHNRSIIGKGTEWFEQSYEDCLEQKMEREARAKELAQEEAEDKDSESDQEDEDEDDDYELDFDMLEEFGTDFPTQPHVNGTESSMMSDEDMFDN